MLEVTEESQIRSIEASLLRRYDGEVPKATIHAEVEASRAHFRDARIRTYVPVLIQREAAGRLRRRPQTVR